MTWTVTKEDAGWKQAAGSDPKQVPTKLHVRAILDIDNEQAELKDLIAALQKHVKEQASG